MKKLFGGLGISWGKLLLFAAVCGVYTGVMAMLPITKDSSFRDISISFECWIFFAVILIVNSKSPLDSALKVFVFFLVSQPLVYLVQVPFSRDGFGLFRYYPGWFRWTLLTFPMAYVGHYMKRDKWWGVLILAPMLLFLGYHYLGFFGEAIHFFPNHLLSALFCAVTMLLFSLYIFRDRRLKAVCLTLSILILLAATVYGLTGKRPHTYDTSLLLSGGETCGMEYDDSYSVYLADERFGTVRIGYEESIESYLVYASFTKTGSTELILESPEGEKSVYALTIERDSYDVRRIEPEASG